MLAGLHPEGAGDVSLEHAWDVFLERAPHVVQEVGAGRVRTSQRGQA